ncbi:MAG: ASCH domain-containing protein [Propionibacteriaceae bacterium]|nr:ASCH domain-containing protein [Propionibacteriaceae bacterium]
MSEDKAGVDLLQQFWIAAQGHAKLGDLDVIVGKAWSQTVVPPAWSFGDSPEFANELLSLVMEDRKTATTSLMQEYDKDEEAIPHVGDLSIILDGQGTPTVLIKTVEVCIQPFGEVTSEQAEAEGEGDRTLESWRADHQRYWVREGYEITDESLVIWERFKVLYSR